MRVLYHHRTQGRGAEGNHIMHTVRELEALGHIVDIVSPPGIDPRRDAGKPPTDKGGDTGGAVKKFWAFISGNLPNFLFEFIEIAYNLRAYGAIKKQLAAHHYDLIYERYAFYLVAGAHFARKKNIPFILEANEVVGIPERARKQVFEKLSLRFEKYLFDRCTRVVTVSSYLKKLAVSHGLETDKAMVQPNGIEPARFQKNTDREAVRSKFNITDEIVFGFAGWFDDWDKLHKSVDVVGNLFKAGMPVKLLLVGDGPPKEKLEAQVNDHGLEDCVVFTGAVKKAEIVNYLDAIDIALLAHSNDFGSPMVLIEFMALAKPVIAPKVTPVLDIDDSGEIISLFDVGDFEKMQENAKSLAASKQDQLERGRLAKEKIYAEYTWPSIVQRVTSGVVDL